MKNILNAKYLVLGATLVLTFFVIPAVNVQAGGGSYNNNYGNSRDRDGRGGGYTYRPVQVPVYNPVPIQVPIYTYNPAPIQVPVYTYNPTPVYPQLVVSCYSNPSSVLVGNATLWSASVSGGNGIYYYSWNGDDGLAGGGQTIYRTYYTAGTKYASVLVTSGGQTAQANCGYVNVQQNYTNYPYNNNYYTGSVYNTYYSPLTASCSANNSNSYGNTVTWTAYASGQTGYFTYSWSGTDGLYGNSQSVSNTYQTPGLKTAYVTIYSNGQSLTVSCASTVNGYNYNNYPYGYQTNNVNGLDIGCYADPTNARVDQPVTWTAEVTGGIAPYTYSWSGSESLSGNQNTVTKYYSSTGSKSAIISVTSADGKTGTHACSNAVNVKTYSSASGSTSGTQTQTQSNGTNSQTQTQSGQGQSTQSSSVQSNASTNTTSQTAASLFSLQNVPWGWIALIVILILFGTVLYLLFNKNKI